MKNLFRNITVISVSFAFFPLFSQEQPATNYEIISEEIDSLLTQISGGFHIVPESSVKLVMNENPLNNYFRQSIVGSLLKHHILLYSEHTSVDSILEINITEASVHFGEVFSESFFGPKLVERVAQISFQTTFRSSGKYYSLPTLTSTSIDTVTFVTAKTSETTGIPFTSYSSPSLSWFDSMLEPLVITVAAGVTVYLFFTIRS